MTRARHVSYLTVAASALAALQLCSVLPAQADGIAWHASLDEAFEAAKSGKLVMLNLYTPMCDWCEELRKVTWPAEVVVAKSAEFECIQADPTGQPAYDKYNNGLFPRILFLSPDGEIAHEVPGFMPPEPFAQEMAGAQENARKLREARELEEQFAEKPDDLTLASRAAKLYLEVHVSHAETAVGLLKPVYEDIGKLEEDVRPQASLDYGVALLMAGQRGQAETVIAETLKQYPDPALAHRAAKLYLDFDLAGLAVAVFGPLYAKLSELEEELHPSILFDYGIALLVDDQLEKGATILQESIGKYPEHPRVWHGRFALGIALANLGKLAEAREQWQTVVDGDPEGPFTERASTFIQQVNRELRDQ